MYNDYKMTKIEDLNQEDKEIQFIIDDEDWNLEGFEKSKSKTVATYAGYFITCGILWLVCRWYPKLKIRKGFERAFPADSSF